MPLSRDWTESLLSFSSSSTLAELEQAKCASRFPLGQIHYALLHRLDFTDRNIEQFVWLTHIGPLLLSTRGSWSLGQALQCCAQNRDLVWVRLKTQGNVNVVVTLSISWLISTTEQNTHLLSRHSRCLCKRVVVRSDSLHDPLRLASNSSPRPEARPGNVSLPRVPLKPETQKQEAGLYWIGNPSFVPKQGHL